MCTFPRASTPTYLCTHAYNALTRVCAHTHMHTHWRETEWGLAYLKSVLTPNEKLRQAVKFKVENIFLPEL